MSSVINKTHHISCFILQVGAVVGYRRNGKVKFSYLDAVGLWIYGYHTPSCCICIAYLF